MTAALWGRGAPGLRLPQGLTPRARKILRQAAGEARHVGSRRIRPEHVLLALARQQEASGRQLMELSGVCVDGVFTQTIDRVNRHREEKRKGKVETTKLLEQFSEDLLEKASSMEPIIGRERELEAVGYNDYYKLLMVRQFKATGRRIWPVVRCMPTEALREVDRILQGGYRPRIVFYDQPGTVNAEGVIASLASKFYQKAFLSFLIS